MFRSTQGNDNISEANFERTGDDVEADMAIFWLQLTPINENSSRIQFVIKINLGGSIPGRLRQVISSKQASFITLLADMCKDNPQEFDDSFNAAKERIDANM